MDIPSLQSIQNRISPYRVNPSFHKTASKPNFTGNPSKEAARLSSEIVTEAQGRAQIRMSKASGSKTPTNIERTDDQWDSFEFVKRQKTVTELTSDLYERNIPSFENPKLYECFSLDNCREETLNRFVKKWYPDDHKRLLERVQQLPPQHRVLLADPAIAQRLDGLINFVNESRVDAHSLKPIELRSKFSAHLDEEYGKQNKDLHGRPKPHKVYRFLALDEEEVPKILERGLMPKSLNGKRHNFENILTAYLEPYRSQNSSNIGMEIKYRFDYPSTEFDRLMSITHDKKLGVAIASQFAKPDIARYIYRFTITPPALSEIHYPRGFRDEKGLDDHKESFIADFIPASAIKKVKFIKKPRNRLVKKQK